MLPGHHLVVTTGSSTWEKTRFAQSSSILLQIGFFFLHLLGLLFCVIVESKQVKSNEWYGKISQVDPRGSCGINSKVESSTTITQGKCCKNMFDGCFTAAVLGAFIKLF